MKKNFISVNMKYSRGATISKITKHNTRQTKVDYLKEHKKYGDNVNIHFSDLETLRQKRLEQRSKFASKKIPSNENEILEMVVALSEEQYKKCNKSDVVEKLKELAQAYKNKYGMEPMDISLHLDEGFDDKKDTTNIHAHITFYNFNFEKNKSILRNLRKSDFVKFQDIAGETFKNLGFQRGISKKITRRKHFKPLEYKEQKKVEKENFIKLKKEFQRNIEKIFNKNDTFFSFNKQQCKNDLLRYVWNIAKQEIFVKQFKEIKENLKQLTEEKDNYKEKLKKEQKLTKEYYQKIQEFESFYVNEERKNIEIQNLKESINNFEFIKKTYQELERKEKNKQIAQEIKTSIDPKKQEEIEYIEESYVDDKGFWQTRKIKK